MTLILCEHECKPMALEFINQLKKLSQSQLDCLYKELESI